MVLAQRPVQQLVIVDEPTVRDLVPKLKGARAEGIVEYPLNKIVL